MTRAGIVGSVPIIVDFQLLTSHNTHSFFFRFAFFRHFYGYLNDLHYHNNNSNSPRHLLTNTFAYAIDFTCAMLIRPRLWRLIMAEHTHWTSLSIFVDNETISLHTNQPFSQTTTFSSEVLKDTTRRCNRAGPLYNTCLRIINRLLKWRCRNRCRKFTEVQKRSLKESITSWSLWFFFLCY